MTYYRCKCGKHEYFSSGMPPVDCQGCDECGTNLATSPEKHKPKAEHSWYIAYDEFTGKPYLRCKRCYQKNKLLEIDCPVCDYFWGFIWENSLPRITCIPMFECKKCGCRWDFIKKRKSR